MIPSFSTSQNGQPPNNLIPQQSTPPIYGAVIRQANNAQSQVQFQQMVPQLSVQPIPNFGFNQSHNNSIPIMNSANTNISLGQPNQNTFAFQTNQWTPTSGQYLQQQNFNHATFHASQPIIATNSPPALISPPRMTFISFPPINPLQMHPPSNINLTVGRQHPYSHQIVTRNHMHFCPYQPPSCINQQQFSPSVWSFNNEPSIPSNTNRVQQPLLRMPTVIIRPNINGGAAIIQLNNYNQRSVGHLGRRASANIEEYLIANKGECSICLDDMDRGNLIARLPCLCIYHKKCGFYYSYTFKFFHFSCIDAWFSRRNTCPIHPPDD
uniref:RING-type E3 ubiquitin transferase n=1 Tax=Meloidogyne hapla TaxID=6305 RepID=A0A1I8B2F5_MELHA